MLKKTWLVISKNQDIVNEIKFALQEKFSLTSVCGLDKSSIRQYAKSVNGIIIYVSDNCIITNKHQITFLKTNFSKTRLVGICNLTELDSIRELGKLGVDKIIASNNLSKLSSILMELSNKKSFEVRLEDFGILKNTFSPLLQKALKIIEGNFTSISTVKEISTLVGVRHEVLSREFKKYNLITPKKLLIQFKIRHAILCIITA